MISAFYDSLVYSASAAKLKYLDWLPMIFLNRSNHFIHHHHTPIVKLIAKQRVRQAFT